LHQTYLKFKHNGKLYKYTVLPNGYTEGSRKFTKTMKPPLAKLKKDDVSLADYIDHLITMNTNFKICLSNVHKIVRNLDDLGFIMHPYKSIFLPARQIEFLGHIIFMTVSLTKEKKDKLKVFCQAVLDSDVTIREVSKLLGKFSSSFLAVLYGRLHYRSVERLKAKALKQKIVASLIKMFSYRQRYVVILNGGGIM